MVHEYRGVPYDFMKIIQLNQAPFQVRLQQTFLITGAHGLTLVRSKYYKGFPLNSISCLLKNKKIVWNCSYGQYSWWKIYLTKKRRKFTLTFALSIKVIIQVWKSQSAFKSSRPEVFCKKVSLEISKNSQKSTCATVSFSIKLQAEAESLF